MLQMGLKCPHLLSKQAENYILASDWQYYDILDIPPSEGAQGPPPPPHTPELKFLIWPSSGPDQYKFIL